MKTLLTGCSGLVGTALVEHLFKNGYSIQCLKRDSAIDANSFWATQNLSTNSDTNFDAVIHLAGENVASGRWTKAKMEAILNSRIDGTRELVDYISTLKEKPKVFLSASAVGYYGNRDNEILYESSQQGVGFLSEVCRRWETEAKRLSALGVRVVYLRFGMILSPHGGALHKMLLPIKTGFGGTIGNGEQYISWISIRDLVNIVDFVINREKIYGPVNVVSPIQTTNKELTETIGQIVNKRTPFKVPARIAKLLFGKMAEEMLLISNRVSPRVLLEADYKFQDQSLESVLTYCINGD